MTIQRKSYDHSDPTTLERWLLDTLRAMARSGEHFELDPAIVDWYEAKTTADRRPHHIEGIPSLEDVEAQRCRIERLALGIAATYDVHKQQTVIRNLLRPYTPGIEDPTLADLAPVRYDAVEHTMDQLLQARLQEIRR